MKEEDKTKERIIHQLAEIHREIAELKSSVVLHEQTIKGYEKNIEWYRTLYENNPSMYFVLDTEGTILSVNLFGAEQLGYTIEELVGQSVLTVFHKEDREAVVQQLKACLRNPIQLFRWEFRKVRKDGSIMWVEEAVRTIRGADGNTIILVVCEDISERKRAEEALQASEGRFASFMQNLPGVAFMKDPEGRYVYVNETWERIFNKRSDDWRAKTDDEIWPPALATQFKENDWVVMESKKALQVIETVPHEDGLHYWFVSKFPILDKEGTPSIVGGIAIDITEQKRVEESLRDSHNQLTKKTNYETIMNTVTRSVYQSINLQDILENTLEVMKRNIESADHISIYLVENDEAVLRAHRGYPAWFIKNVKRILSPHGLTWKTINESKSQHIHDVETIHDAIEERDIGTKSFLSVPIQYTGKTVGVIKISSLEKHAFSEEEVQLLERITRQIEGAITHAEISEALRQSEERYRTLFDQSPVGIYIFNREFKITQCNKRLIDILQSSFEKIVGLDMRKLKDQSLMPEAEKVFEGQSAYKEGLYEATTSSAILWLSVRMFPLRDVKGAVICGMGVVEDITEQKHIERQIRERLAVEEALAEVSRLFVSALEPELNQVLKIIGGAVSASRAYIFLFREKGTRADITHEWCNTKTKPRIGDLKNMDTTLLPWWMKKLEGGENILISDVNTLPKEAKAERTILESHSISSLLAVPINFMGDRLLGFMGFDDTEHCRTWSEDDARLLRVVSEMLSAYLMRKQMEEDLLNAKKLESIGVLARGIAHDFDNLLAVILGNLSLAEKYAKDKMLHSLGEAEKASLRARALTLQLRNFTKGGPPIRKAGSTKELLENLTGLIAKGSNVKFELSLPDDLWSVEVDEVQISQVLYHLLIKADQAMPEDAVIRINAENIAVTEEDGTLFKKSGKYVKIAIQDERVEIAEEHLSKIFDPYSTTKEEGENLGFAIACSIIENHNGYIDVELNLEVGTKFYIYLPAIEEVISLEEEVLPQENAEE